MLGGILIDDRGEAWPDLSFELARRLGYPQPDFDVVAYAVRNIGFIHLRPRPAGLRVSLRTGLFNRTTLTGALYTILEMQPQRIMLDALTEDVWSHQMFTELGGFAEHVEALAAGEPIAPREKWSTEERDIEVVSLPAFSRVRPLVRAWQKNRGRLSNDLLVALGERGLLQRSVLARQPPRSSRLVVEHFGAGIKMLRPCEALLVVGRDLDDVPDQDYGAWVAKSYDETLGGGRLRLESVRAIIRTSEATTLRTRYDRLIMPWRRTGNDIFVLGISIQREVATVA